MCMMPTSQSNTTSNQYGAQGQTYGQINQGSQYGSSSVGPNTGAAYQGMINNMPGQYAGIMGQLQSLMGQNPYGPQQQANYQQQLNRQMGAAQRNVNSQLAATGALNSARAGQAATGIQLGGAQQMGNYLAQVPALQAQYKQGILGEQAQLLGQQGAWRPDVGTSSTGIMQTLQSLLGSSTGSSTQTGSQQTTQSSNLLSSILGGLIQSGMGFLTGGLSSLAGGGGGGDMVASNWGNSYNAGSLPGMGPSNAPAGYGPGYSPGGFSGASNPFSIFDTTPQQAPPFGG